MSHSSVLIAKKGEEAEQLDPEAFTPQNTDKRNNHHVHQSVGRLRGAAGATTAEKPVRDTTRKTERPVFDPESIHKGAFEHAESKSFFRSVPGRV